MEKTLFALTLFYFVVGSQGQTCDSRQFAIRNSAGEDYLTINSPTDVKTCGGVNICTEISAAKQALALSNDGTLSISNGNSVQIPDTSSTNEIQTLNLDPSGQLTITSGNSVNLPDNSATNEIQTLSINSDTISLSNGGGSIAIPDTSATNEIQQLSINNNEMSISDGNTVELPSAWSYTKSYTYTSGNAFSALTWTAIPPYELLLNIPRNFSVLQITLYVPYTGNDTPNKRARIQLMFDGVPICDATILSQSAYLLLPFQFYGIAPNVSPGNHVIQLRGFVDSGNTFYIPAYAGALGEGIAPAIFSTYSIVGFP